ncbi:unnamed protein product [Vitrella brassicaformis CCMP3155]|uniref:Uncharacterized protein n=1 Tax=Vitrella brassicaformis (strain CCMP3155) TaxID=1169540 RepID=A0A0G4GPV9_VITBC|nr:unnamed protein product [Vitrella brassicaformis CCMP3155]|eukprot:CEM32391.1 unnamed protein product [Vitrella brassicaformis CCMP3155]
MDVDDLEAESAALAADLALAARIDGEGPGPEQRQDRRRQRQRRHHRYRRRRIDSGAHLMIISPSASSRGESPPARPPRVAPPARPQPSLDELIAAEGAPPGRLEVLADMTSREGFDPSNTAPPQGLHDARDILDAWNDTPSGSAAPAANAGGTRAAMGEEEDTRVGAGDVDGSNGLDESSRTGTRRCRDRSLRRSARDVLAGRCGSCGQFCHGRCDGGPASPIVIHDDPPGAPAARPLPAPLPSRDDENGRADAHSEEVPMDVDDLEAESAALAADLALAARIDGEGPGPEQRQDRRRQRQRRHHRYRRRRIDSGAHLMIISPSASSRGESPPARPPRVAPPARPQPSLDELIAAEGAPPGRLEVLADMTSREGFDPSNTAPPQGLHDARDILDAWNDTPSGSAAPAANAGGTRAAMGEEEDTRVGV